MNEFLRLQIARCRRLHQNPYAFIEYFEGFEDKLPAVRADAKGVNSRISVSRKTLEDPYAYLDGDGGFSAAASAETMTQRWDSASSSNAGHQAKGNVPRRYSDPEIEVIVKSLQRRLWHERERLWDGVAPTNPVEILDIRKALHLVGYDLAFEAGLGHHPGSHIEVAGMIDRDAKLVSASLQFLEPYRTFTLAHELGHAVLHPNVGGVHRDRPLDGATLSRELGEREADKFATYFLMPGKLLRERFMQCFGTSCFTLTEESAFALSRTSSDVVTERNPTRRHISRTLAAAETYDGRSFISLNAQFRVSVEAMAIRLEELDLLEGKNESMKNR